jgi:hypothetical protein
MRNIDIQYALALRIKEKTPTFAIKVDKSKTDVKVPTLIIDVRPLKTYMYQYNKVKLVNVTIIFTDVIMSHEKSIATMDILENLFNEQLKTGDRYLTIQDLDFVETDKLLNCNFTLDYFDDKNQIYDDVTVYEKMQELLYK